MNAPHETQYIAGASPLATLAQARAQEIERRLEMDLRPEVERLDEAITRKTEQLHSNWQTHANDTTRAAAAQRDLEQLHRDRDLARTIVAGAEQELEIAQRQITADRLLAHRAAVDKALSARVDAGRQIVDFLVGVVGQYRELCGMGERVVAMFSDHDRAATGLTINEAQSLIDRKDLQGDVELIFESLLTKRLWAADRPILPYAAQAHERLIETLDAERLSVLRGLDAAISQVTSTGTLGQAETPDVHAEAMARTQARAAAGAL